jgi:uncharacterized RDD family membrane protein YckC
MTEEKYPGVLDRVKAIVIDSIVIVLFIVIMTYIFALFENVPEKARIIAFVFIFILYDPLFTSIFGGTIGHMIIGIRVKRESNEMKNIQFHLAILRYIVKFTLGIISLFTVLSNKKGKAIHDFLVGSVVIYA